MMQKFTVFSIILSVIVVLVISDLVLHDYLGTANQDNFDEAANVATSVFDVPTEGNGSLPTAEEYFDILDMIEPSMTAQQFVDAGFTGATLKETTYFGLIFQLISFSDQNDAFVHQWNLFDGQEFVGTVYEIDYSSATGGLQGYLTLRERASGLASEGDVNEVNMYGDASFYFNHKVKNKTVHTVIRDGAIIYAFEYAYVHHDNMKKVMEGL